MSALLATAAVGLAQGPAVFISHYSKSDFALTADPNAKPWKNVRGVVTDIGPRGGPVAGHRTEIRSRWTNRNLYLLYICPYEALYLHPNPQTTSDTNRLWEWDVAEAFIGSDFQNINLYKEFEVSPQGEWIDLDIDRHHMNADSSLRWNSGWKVKARIDREKKIWYAEMQIPMNSIDPRPPKPGLEMRANFYRCQGPPPNRKLIAWQPTGAPNFHVPEKFGLLRLGK